ncbi:MAG: YscO family type III secretion system apparatus protein [Pseudomonadota bacterium]
MLSRLLRIKRLREERAVRETQEAVRAVAAAERAVAEAEEALSTHQAFRKTEEPRLFGEVKGTPVALSRLDRLKEDIAALKALELELEDAVATARRKVAEAEAALQAAEAAQREAERAVAKFEEFVAVEDRRERDDAVAREDAEIEEVSEAVFATRSRG